MSQSFPQWLRRPWASGDGFEGTKALLEGLGLHTVCQSAHCPNLGECWGRGAATFMLLGNTCTRNCAFCSVPSGTPDFDDENEPGAIAEAVQRMGLRHAVVTTVARDDLSDQGAGHIAETIRAIHERNPSVSVEILISDFRVDEAPIRAVLDARPEVFCHNVETVERIYPAIRDRRFSYRGALDVLRRARAYAPNAVMKSAMMVGLGEKPEEVRATMRDLLEAGCEAICIGQYLRPTPRQIEVAAYVHPDQFKAYEEEAYALGFKFAVAGPFVRSSYRSEEVLGRALHRDSRDTMSAGSQPDAVAS